MSNSAYRRFRATVFGDAPERVPRKSTHADYTKAVYARKGADARAAEARDVADNELYLMENRLQRRRVAHSLAPYEKSGLSLNDPVVKFGAFAGIFLIGSGLLMKTYHKYFGDGQSVVGDAVTGGLIGAGGGVSDVVGDISREIGETAVAIPVGLVGGAYDAGISGAEDAYRAFLAAGDSSAEAGRKTQEWIDAQVSGVGDMASGFVGGLLGNSDSTDDFAFGGGSPDPTAGFGGSWGEPTPIVPTPYAPDPSLGLSGLQDIFIAAHGHLPEGVEYVGAAGYAGCDPDCHYVGRGLGASLVCARTCPAASSYADFLASHLSVVPSSGEVFGPPASADASSGGGTGNAGLVPSGGPGMPDYS